ncbi:MAG: class I SAM-dependent methyltransferase [Acidobacteriaceae bacterium]
MPATPPTAPTNFNHLARPYRWLEYLTFGPMLERCRFHRIPQLAHARRALVLGDGDGRFLARLLAANPTLYADVVDQSPSMLRLLQARAAAIGAAPRIRIHQADALAFQPTSIRDVGERSEQPPEPFKEPGAKRGCLDGRSRGCLDGEPRARLDCKSSYDLVITHFFLDCFTTEQVHALAQNIRPHLAPNALWIVSEFAIPPGRAALPARAVVNSLYLAFRILTGLRTRTLPDHAAALTQNGLSLRHQQPFLAGLVISQQWQLTQ